MKFIVHCISILCLIAFAIPTANAELYKDGRSQTVDVENTGDYKDEGTPPKNRIVNMGITGADFVGPHDDSPNGTPDMWLHIEGVELTPRTVTIQGARGKWVHPYNGQNWGIHSIKRDGNVDLFFEPYYGEPYSVLLTMNDGTFLEYSTATGSFLGAGGNGTTLKIDGEPWTWLDPQQDARFILEEDKVTISAPPNNDFWPGVSYGAPQLTQSVTGDFVLTARVKFTAKDANYNGAGLFVRASQKTFLRLERQNGDRVSVQAVADGNVVYQYYVFPFTGTDLYLRIVRDGEVVTAAIRPADRTIWREIAHFPLSLPEEVEAGVILVSSRYSAATSASFSEISVSSDVRAISKEANLLQGAAIVTKSGVEGHPAMLIDGTILPEGSARNISGTVRFETAGSFVVYDLKDNHHVQYLDIQADHNDNYHVDISDDAENWSQLGVASMRHRLRPAFRRERRPRDVRIEGSA